MPPAPKSQVPISSFDSDEESLLLPLHHGEPKHYSDLLNNDGDSDDFTKKEESSSFLSYVWSRYFDAMLQRPILVKGITAFVLLGFADLIAQGVEHIGAATLLPSEEAQNVVLVDWIRAARFAVFGFLGAPWAHYYYDWLDTVLPPTPQPWTMTTAAKVIIDQGVQAPALLALIISGMSIMMGDGLDGTVNDMRNKYIPTLLDNWKLWIPATIINIAFVKPALRVLYDNLIFFVWTVYLSIRLNAK